MASSMVAQMKPTTLAPSDFLVQGFDLGFFCGVGFSRPLGLNEIKSGILDDHVLRVINEKTLIKVSTMYQLLGQMLECRNHMVLTKDWTLNMGKLNTRFIYHSPSC